MRLSASTVGVVLRRARRLATDHAAATGSSAESGRQPHSRIAADLGELVYELLDAQADTRDLATELQYDPTWAAHVDYLTALQRRAREVLAHSHLEIPA